MSDWTLVEPCCGSAALTMHLLGATRQILPYQGSKWKFRHALALLLANHGFVGSPSSVELTDCSYWGHAFHDILVKTRRAKLLTALRRLAKGDPKDVYDALQGSLVETPGPLTTSEFLFLQRLAFSGKAVGIKGGKWNSPGFNITSAYGVEETDTFGKVNPMVPSLVGVLKALDRKLPAKFSVNARCGLAQPPPGFAWRTVVYIDPDYTGTTPYPDGTLPREQVIELAEAWQAAGAFVIISEKEPLTELYSWESKQLYAGTDKKSPFKGKHEEWVTYSPERP